MIGLENRCIRTGSRSDRVPCAAADLESECAHMRTTCTEQGLIGVDECGDSDPVATAPGSDVEQVECGGRD